jgi:hypothetical protein
MLPMKHIQVCMKTCQDEYSNLQKHQKDFIQSVVAKHQVEFIKIGGLNVLTAFQKADFLGVVRALNALLIHPDTSKVFTNLLSDYKEIYKANENHINTAVDCYINKCSKESIDMLRECVLLAKNMVSLIKDKDVMKEIHEILGYIVDYATMILKRFNEEPKKDRSSQSSKSSRKSPKSLRQKKYKTV